MSRRDERRARAAKQPSCSSSASTFGILDEWAEGLGAAAAQAESGAQTHRDWAEAYWEARVATPS